MVDIEAFFYHDGMYEFSLYESHWKNMINTISHKTLFWGVLNKWCHDFYLNFVLIFKLETETEVNFCTNIFFMLSMDAFAWLFYAIFPCVYQHQQCKLFVLALLSGRISSFRVSFILQ